MEQVDLVLKGGQYLDSQKREFIKADIAIKDGRIVGIGEGFKGKEERNITGKTIVPGFVDGHIHLESSIIAPKNFAKIATVHGTTAVITDPHEITNILGEDGINYMLQATENLPIDVFFAVPSCVPATPFDESGGTLDSKTTKKIFDSNNKRIVGLAEMMNFPGVLSKNSEVIEKIKAAQEHGLTVDGHAPGLTGEALEQYIAAGILSDHECSSLKEAIEKIETAKKLGMKFHIMVREGTAAKNLEALFELLNMEEYKENIMLVTDDKHPEELREEGHIDHIIRKAIKLGVNPEDAYISASTNAAKYFGLSDIGSIEKGKKANIVILDDIRQVGIDSVYKEGENLTTEKLQNWEEPEIDEELNEKVRNTINLPRELTIEDIASNGKAKQVIGLIPEQIITTDEGAAKDYDLENDIIKAVVIESHKGTMHMSTAFLKGMGLKKGVVATTVAHDSHYLIVAGTNDNDIVTAVNEIKKTQGGKVYVEDGEVQASLALPLAGLMTDENPSVVTKKMDELKDKAKVNEGIDPFMNLSFVSLGVIGDIRLLPGGPFDVNKWRFISQEDIDKKYKEQNREEDIGNTAGGER